jgi:hypothetical protein
MKATGRCPKCRGSRIGHFLYVYDTYEAGPHTYGTQHAGVTADKDARTRGRGELEAYVCAGCGLYETYVKDIARLRFDELAEFEWLPDRADPGPYR